MIRARLAKVLPWLTEITAVLLYTAPLFCAFFVVNPSTPFHFLFEYVELNLLYFILFPTWDITRRIAAPILGANRQRGRLLRWPGFILVACGVIVVLAALTSLRTFVSDLLFQMIVALLPVGVIAEFFRIRGMLWQSVLMNAAYYTAVGYVGFLIQLGELQWQPVVFSGGVALSTCLLICRSMLKEHFQSSEEIDQQLLSGQRRRILQLIPLLILLAPFLPATLVYATQLPKIYLLVLVVLPFGMGIIRTCQELTSDQQIPERLLRDLVTVPFLFVLVLFGLRLFG